MIGIATSLHTAAAVKQYLTVRQVADRIEEAKKTGAGKPLYEWFNSEQPLKLYVDVDGKGVDTDGVKKQIVKYVADYFHEDAEYVMCFNNEPKKGKPFSGMHIIFPAIVIENIASMKKFVEKMKKDTGIGAIDSGCYGETQKFRTPYARKSETDSRPYRYEDEDADTVDFIIQANNRGVEVRKIEAGKKGKGVRKTITATQVNDTIEIEVVDETAPPTGGVHGKVETLLSKLSSEYYEKYELWWKVGQSLSNSMGDAGWNIFRQFSMKSEKWNGVHSESFERRWNEMRNNTHNNKYKNMNVAWLVKEAGMERKEEMEFDVVATAEKILPIVRENCVVITNDEMIKTKNYKTYDEKRRVWDCGMSAFKNFVYERCIENADGEPKKRTLTFMEGVLKMIEMKMTIVKDTRYDKFDTLVSTFLPFVNGILNLKDGNFIPHKKEYFVSRYIDYEFHEMTREECEATPFYQTVSKIFVNEDMRRLALQTLSTTLIGENLQKFIIWTGVGGNGKGWLGRVLMEALTQQFSILGNTHLLVKGGGDGASPALANLGMKRCVLFNEPASKERIDNEFLKKITGGDKITARGLYDANTEKKNHLTVIIQANDIPLLKATPSEAEDRRCIIVAFDSLFRSDMEEDVEMKVFKADDTIEKREFIEECRLPFINLLKYYAMDYIRTRKFDIPKESLERKKRYFNSCNPFTDFLEDTLVKEEEGVVKLRDLLRLFKGGEGYEDLLKVEKRRYNEKSMRLEIGKSALWRKYFKEEVMVSKERYYGVFVGWKIKDDVKGEEDTVGCLLNELDE